MEHLKQETVSGAQLNMDALYQICPQCFTESKDPKTGEVRRSVDFEKLRLLLGDNIAEGDERYDFTWVGKRAALQEAAKPIRKTLRPCPEESVDWENTKNLYIEGDNLEVMKLLLNAYMGKIKVLYFDPPYNTGNDFVYHDDFHQTKQDYDLFAGDVNEEGERLIKNTETNGRFHSDWCSMMYSRLMVARSLLAEDGVVFISIDDNEQKNMKNLCDEVFGEMNFLAQVVWERAFSPINLMKHFSPSHDYVLVYAKNPESAICNGIPRSQEANDRYSNPDNDPRGVWSSSDISVGPAVQENIYPITTPSGRVVEPPAGRSWSLSRNAFRERLQDNRIWFGPDGDNTPRIKRFLSELRKTGITPMTIWKHEEVGHSQDATQKLAKIFDGKKYFDYPKPVGLIKRCLALYSEKDSIIMDFFSGSGTTAQAMFELNQDDGGNRRFILIQLPEKTDEKSPAYKDGYFTICDIAKERIRRAGKKILVEQKDKQGDLFSGEQKKLDVGFRVFKCADSNMKDVYYAPVEYSQELLLGLEDNIKEDRNDLDLLFGCMLDWGVTLDLPLRTEKVDGVNIHIVNEGDLVACFEKQIPESVIDHIASLLPMRVVLRDSCFDEAKEKMNFFEIFKQRTGWSEEEVRKNVKVI
ncbi:MAG: site-specific DNA-methyltransferase [Prevotella sp.]|nr:site-specific DNA-methyltransferase [Prevotella sp.]